MKALIIPDIHGKAELLDSMLRDINDYDRVVQVGDLCNCVVQDIDGDVECIGMIKKLRHLEYDITCLVGNHEYPYFNNGRGSRFGGFCDMPEVRNGIISLNMQAAVTIGDTLITHAGVHPAYENFNRAYTLNYLWERQPTHPVFNDCGYVRGGRQEQGGILWRDFSEDSSNVMHQVFGHTKDTTVRIDENDNVCIDCEQPYVIEY